MPTTKFLVLNLIIFIMATSLSAKEKTVSSHQLFDLMPNIEELETGRILAESFRLLRRDKRPLSLLKKLNKRTQSSELFNHLGPVIHSLTLFLGNPKVNFRKECPGLWTPSIYESPTEELITNIYKKRCVSHFLKTNGGSKFNSHSEVFLKKATTDIINGRNKSDLERFLKKFRKKHPKYPMISKVLFDEYKIQNRKLSSKIASRLFITDDLTHYLQKKGFIDSESNKVFNSKFKRMINDFYSLFNSGSSIEAKIKAEEARKFFLVNKDNIDKLYVWRNLIYMGKKYLLVKDYKMAHALIDALLTTDFPVDETHEVYFNKIWIFIEQGHEKKAVQFVKKYKLVDQFPELSTKLQYWIAVTFKNSGDPSYASYLNKKTIKTSPLSFYSIVASKNLGDPGEMKVNLPSTKLSKNFDIHLGHDVSTVIKRVSIWSKLDQGYLLQKDVDLLLNLLKNHQSKPSRGLASLGAQYTVPSAVAFQLVKHLNRTQRYLDSFKAFYQSVSRKILPLSKEVVELLFPFQFYKKIRTVDSSINPIVVLSLIRQESAFNPNARSHVGARGLMQLMPATARMYKRRVKAHQLRDPKLNLRIGIKYLKKLLDKYDGNLLYALAAYNAGEGNLRKWISEHFVHADPIKVIESIPFKETRKYVKLIYRNMFIYSMLVGNEKFLQADLKESFTLRGNW